MDGISLAKHAYPVNLDEFRLRGGDGRDLRWAGSRRHQGSIDKPKDAEDAAAAIYVKLLAASAIVAILPRLKQHKSRGRGARCPALARDLGPKYYEPELFSLGSREWMSRACY